MSDLSIPPLAVAADTPFSLDRADRLARTLNLPLLEAPVADPRRCDRAQQLLWVGDAGLALQRCGRGAPGPVRVDWLDGKAAHRRQQGGGVGQLVARAVGLHKASRPLTVVDATAGLGQDAFVLATLGAQVTLLERSPVMAALLEDGLARARASEDPDVQTILARMTLIPADSIAWLQDQPEVADVVYLDPMFPERGKSALVKKEMRVCRPVTGDDEDARELLAAARTAARSRVVVKRPRKGARIDGPEPDTVLSGKSSRYDLYTRRALP